MSFKEFTWQKKTMQFLGLKKKYMKDDENLFYSKGSTWEKQILRHLRSIFLSS